MASLTCIEESSNIAVTARALSSSSEPAAAFCLYASPKIHFLALSKVGKCIYTLLPPVNRVPNRTRQYLDFPILCGPTLMPDGRSAIAERFVLSGERGSREGLSTRTLSEIRVCFDNTIVTV